MLRNKPGLPRAIKSICPSHSGDNTTQLERGLRPLCSIQFRGPLDVKESGTFRSERLPKSAANKSDDAA